MELARRHQQELVTERGMGTEAQVLEVINELLLLSTEPRVSVKEITERFIETYGDEYDRKVTHRWIGNVLRKKLGLKPYKSDGTFIIGLTTKTRSLLKQLAAKHGISFAPADAEEETSESASPDKVANISC